MPRGRSEIERLVDVEHFQERLDDALEMQEATAADSGARIGRHGFARPLCLTA